MLCLAAHLDAIELIVISACTAYVDRVHEPLATLQAKEESCSIRIRGEKRK
jgi:hypothetical protein